MTGTMQVPANFQYYDVLAKGYPKHIWTDPFRIKHPSMDCSKRAKIFNPFDALKGFDEAVASQEILYENRRELDDEELIELNRRLALLHNLAGNSKLARSNRVIVSVTYYIPCQDQNHSAFGYRGQYVTVTGAVKKITVSNIVVGITTIPLSEIIGLESEYEVTRFDGERGPIFENPWSD